MSTTICAANAMLPVYVLFGLPSNWMIIGWPEWGGMLLERHGA